MNPNIARSLENAVQTTAADISNINAWTMKATMEVANAIMEGNPDWPPERAMLAAISITQKKVDDQLAGRNMWKRELPPAVLGRALREEYGDYLLKRLVAGARTAADQHCKEMRKAREPAMLEWSRKNAAAMDTQTVSPSLGLDLGAIAREVARGHAIHDEQAAVEARKANRIIGGGEGFIEGGDGASLAQTDAVNGLNKERGPAPSPARVSAALARADTAVDLSGVKSLSKYPAKPGKR